MSSRSYYTDAHSGFHTINEHVPSDTDRTRSPSPFGENAHNIYKSTPNGHRLGANGVSREILSATQASFAESPRGLPDQFPSQRIILKTRPYRPNGSSPGPARSSSQPPGSHSTPNMLGSRRSRPETSHQKAVNMNRKMRIDHIIHQKLMQEHAFVRQRREGQKRTTFFRSMRRIRDLPDDYASDKDDSWGPGGLLPNADEEEDYGEEALELKKVLDRTVRRLEREENGRLPSEMRTAHRKRKRRSEDHMSEDEHDGFTGNGREKLGGKSRDERLDDLDLDLLGESRDEEQMDEEQDDDSGDDDSDDMTEEEGIESHT